MNKIFAGLSFTLSLILYSHGFSQDTLYWVGGTGSWGENQHWSLTSGGIGGTGVPGPTTSVVFDQNSFSSDGQSVMYETGIGPYFTSVECNDMIWRNIPYVITVGGAKPIFIFGKLVFLPNLNFTFVGQTTFAASNKNVTIKTAGKAIPTGVVFDGNEGHWELQDDLYVLGNIDLNKGHLITNSFKVTCFRFNSAPVNFLNKRSLNLGSSLLTVRSMNKNITNISCRFTNVGNSLDVFTSGHSMILFTGDIVESDNLCTMDAADSLKFDYIEFLKNGELIAKHDTFNDALFRANGTMFVDTCIFDSVEIYQRGLAYTNKCHYNRFLFSTHPSYCGCGDCRNIDYGWFEGDNNQVSFMTRFYRNGTIKGNNNINDTCRFEANGSILSGENTFNKVMMRRIWQFGCSCPSYSPDTLTLEQNMQQIIYDSIILFGEYWCHHARLTSNSSLNRASVASVNSQFLDYIEIQGIDAVKLSLPSMPFIAKRSIDLGNNLNWTFLNTYTPLADSLVTITDVFDCHDAHNGTVTLWGMGGEKPYTYHRYTGTGGCSGGYSPNDPPTNNLFTGLGQGNYSFMIKDAYGCESVIVNATVGGPTAVVINAVDVTSIPCYNDPPNSNGQIMIHSSGGTGPHEYYLDPRAWQTDSVFTNIALGEHQIRVRDSLGCLSPLDTIVMTQRPEQFLMIQTPDVVTCWGDSVGKIRIRTWGGTPPYEVLIDPVPLLAHPQNPINAVIPQPNQSNPVEFLVYAGNYHIVVTDANGCIIDDFRQVFENPKIEFTYSKQTVTVGNSTTYCLEVTPEGGIPPYEHHWNNGTTSNIACGLLPGLWCDTITDNVGCRDTACILIEPLAIQPITDDTVCFGTCTGFTCVNAYGGSTPYQYLWSNASTQPCLVNVCPGNYSVTVTDASGGVVSGSVVIHENPQIEATFSIDTVSCGGGNDGSLTITASGGEPFTSPPNYEFRWSTGSTSNTISGLTAGVYSVTVTDSIGCSRSFSATMPQPTPITLGFTTGSTNLCASYIAQANASGGNPPYTYLWSNGQTTNPAINLAPGTYSVTVTDSKACTKTGSVTITALSAVTTQTQVTCFGHCNGTATVTASGSNKPYTIVWTKVPENTVIAPSTATPVSSTISNLCPGNYLATVTDSNNCSITRSVTISQPVYPLEVVTLVYTNTLDCYGDCDGTASVYATGGTAPYTYRWEKSSPIGPIFIGTQQNMANLCAGNYCVTITDANSCRVDTCFTINQPTQIQYSYTQQNIPCYVNGDAGSITIENVTGGTPPYTYSIHCPNGIYVNGNIFGNLPPATYQIGVQDSKGCKSACTDVTITRPTAVASVFNPVNHPTGNGLNNGSITASASGGVPPYEHFWFDAAGVLIQQSTGVASTLQNLFAGTYCDSIVDANHCFTKRCTTLVEPSALTINVDSSHISCFGKNDGWITITIVGGVSPYSIQWAAPCVIGCNNNTISNLAAGYYSVQVTDFNNNTTTRAIQIIEPQPITISFQHNEVCHGAVNGSIQALPSQGTPPFNHSWNNGMATALITDLIPNQWYVDTVTDSRGCKAYDSVFLPENPPLFVQINNIDSTVCKFESLQMIVNAYGGTFPYGFSWAPVTGVSDTMALEPTITPTFGETYVVTMTDWKGCSTADSITITVDSLPYVDFTYQQICQSRTVSFTNLSTGYPTSALQYLWDFGDGNLSTLKDPQHTFTGPLGPYNVSLTATTADGCTSYKMMNISINPSIQVNFQADTACLGTPTQLWAQSFNPATVVTTLKWYFDDLPAVTVAPPPFEITNTFSYAGGHSVKLVMSDATGCSDSITKPVYVRPAPATDFSYTWYCSSDTVFFTDLTPLSVSADTIYYQWEFGDPGSGPANYSNLKNPKHVYVLSGSYQVRLTVTFVFGAGMQQACSFSKIKQLYYIKSPFAGFTHTNPCFAQTTQFTDQSYAATGNVIMWQWNFGDPNSGFLNTSNIQNPSHVYTAPGAYQVKLKVYDSDLCFDSVLHNVIVHQPPLAGFNARENCVGQMTQFTDLSTEGDTTINYWFWDFGDSQTMTYTTYNPTIIHPYAVAGSYTVTLTVRDRNGCEHSISRSIQVHPEPQAMFSTSPACAGQLTYFNDQSNGSGSAVISWQWNFGDMTPASTLQNPTHTYSVPGVYNVSLCIMNSDSCVNCITQAISIYPVPVADFTADSVCVGSPTQFDNLSFCSGDIITSWLWEFGDGTPSSNMQWPFHTFTAPGTYQVSLTVETQHGCSASVIKPVTVHQLPVANFSWDSNGGQSCFNASTPTTFNDLSTITGGNLLSSWHWDFGDGNYSNLQNPSHQYSAPGTFYVTLEVSDINGCRHAVTKAVTLGQKPEASFTFSISNCDQVCFTDASIGSGSAIQSWFWNFGDPASGVNNQSLAQNPCHNFLTPVTQSYNVRLIVANATGCTDTLIIPVNISKPEANFTTTGAICENAPTVFQDLSVSTGNFITTWSWDFGDPGSSSNTSALQNPWHQYTTVGTKYVTLSVTNGNGCTVSIGKPIDVSYAPEANWDYDRPNCFPGATQFRDISSALGSVPIVSWDWDFGDATPHSTLQEPTHNFSIQGTYTITLRVTNANGCEHTVAKPFYFYAAPTVAFTTFPALKCQNSLISFTDQSIAAHGNIAFWKWDFGDNSPIVNIQNPSHVFSSSGTFEVKLIVTDDRGCTDSLVQQVMINEKPATNFSADTACLGSPTQFTNLTPGTSLSWLWDFGEPSSGVFNSSNLENPAHTYNAAGDYYVSLLVTNSNTCQRDTVKKITVVPVPLVNFSYSSPCSGIEVQFIDESIIYQGSVTVWRWNFGDLTGDVTEQNPVHTFNNPGTYNVTLTISTSGNCPSTSITKQVNIKAAPVVNFIPATACLGAVQFTDLTNQNGGTTMITWDWNFGDPGSASNNTSQLQNPLHIYSSPGMFNVTLVVANTDGCKDTLISPVQILPLPGVEFNAGLSCSSDTTCFFLNTTITNTGAITSYEWDLNGDGAVDSYEQQPCHIYPVPGTVNVTLIVTDTSGCENTVTHPVHIQVRPAASFITEGNNCANDSVRFTNLSTSSSGYIEQWRWNFGDGTGVVVVNFPANPNISHLFPGTGPYTVTLTVVSSIGCEDSESILINLKPAPVPMFSFSNPCSNYPVQFSDLSTPNGGGLLSAWEWNFGDPGSLTNNTSILQNPIHLYSNSGNFQVNLLVTNSNGCKKDTTIDIFVKPLPSVDFSFESSCQNQETQFTTDPIVTNLNNITSFYWLFGDGTFSTEQNPVHIYQQPGTFDVILEVTDTSGCSNRKTHTITVRPSPWSFFSNPGITCASDSVPFTNLSTSTYGYIQQWKWDFGDGSPNQIISFPSDPNVKHRFDLPGNFLVTLTITNSFGCIDDYSHVVTVLPTPVANFHYSDTCENMLVQFNDASFANGVGNLVSWSWDFGDPASGVDNTSSLQNPSHIFASGSGSYPVRLIIVNFNNCTDTITKQIYIRSAPPVDYSYDQSCVNHLVTFTANPGVMNLSSIATWDWDFGDGTAHSTSPANAQHLYAAPGEYHVSLTVTDLNGCVNSKADTIKISPPPLPFFTFSSAPCDSMPVLFTDGSTIPAGIPGYIQKWTWHWGDGSPAETILHPASPNVSHLFPTDVFDFNVKLVVESDLGCLDSVTRTVHLNPKPIALFELLPETPSCTGQTVTFHDLSEMNGGGTIDSWLWDFGEPTSGMNNQSILQNPTHIYSSAGSFIVKLVVKNLNNCSDTFRLSVNITDKPYANFSTDIVCAGAPTNFTDLSIANSSGGIISYHWEFGDGNSSTLPNPQNAYASPGLYLVTLTVTNSNGCIKDTTRSVLVNPNASAAFSYPGNHCQGSPVCFTDVSTLPVGFSGYIAQWEWDFGDGTTPEVFIYPTNPAQVCHIFQGAALMHDVRLTITTSTGCEATVMHQVSSQPSPVSNFDYSSINCASQEINFNDLSQTNGGQPVTQWFWDFGDPVSGSANNSTIQHPSHIFTTAGDYLVRLIVKNAGLCSDTILKTVSVNLSPVANFQHSGHCAGSEVSFTGMATANASSITSWSWSFGDGGTSAAMNPSHTFLANGTYDVTLTVVNSNGCVHDTVKSLVISAKPLPVYSISTPACDSSEIAFTDLSSLPSGATGLITHWNWDFGDGSLPVSIPYPTSPNVTHQFPGGTLNWLVKLVVTTDMGCKDSVQQPVALVPRPLAAFEVATGTPSCALQPVQFTDLSQNNGGGNIVFWQWNFDDPVSGAGNSSTSVNPVHIFSTAGTYQVSLTVTNGNGCSHSLTLPVVVHAKPVAGFSADTACAGSPTHFTNTSVSPGSPLSSYSWTFGDGGTSSLASPEHIYSSSGIYSVNLAIINTQGCSQTVSRQVPVSPKPVAQFTYSSTSCVGNPVSFTDQSFIPAGFTGYIQTWIWDFGDGSASTIIQHPATPNITHTFLGNATHHDVRLKVITTTGCTDSITKTVNSIPSPIANFSHSNATCFGQPVSFTDLSQLNGGGSIQSWNWNFGDPQSGSNNTSTQQNPIHSFTATGAFTVTLIVTNTNGCSKVHDSVINVDPLPEANFSFVSACVNTPVAFTDLSIANAGSTGQIISYAWNFGDGGTSIQPSPSHTFTTHGSYSVSLTIVNSNGCIHTVTKSVDVYPDPVPGFTYSPIGCMGQPVNFYNQSFLPTGYAAYINKWEWDFGDGTMPVTVNYPDNPDVAHTFQGTASSHVVRLTVTTTNNCTAYTEKTIASELSPVANFSISPARCQDQPVQFTDLTQMNGGGNIQTWSWNFGDPLSGANNTSSLKNPIHSFTGTGPFTVSLIVTNINGCTSLHDTVVNINPLPEANFTYNTVCEGTVTTFSDASVPNAGPSGQIVTYSWNFGDGGTSTLQSPQHTFASYGNNTVSLEVTNSNGCIHSITKQVLVNPKPMPEFTYSPAGCIGQPVYYFSQSYVPSGFSSYITTWTWDFGDGSITPPINLPASPNISHTFLGNGVAHIVRLTTTTNTGCIAYTEKTVNSIPSPLANFSFSTVSCINQPVVFTDLTQQNGGSALQTWNWNFGDPLSGASNNSSLQNPSHTFTTTGSFTVTLTVTNTNGCSHIIDTVVEINPLPTAAFTNNSACEGEAMQFTNTSQANAGSAGIILTNSWNFGDGNSSTLLSPSHSFGSYGNFPVTLTVMNSNGCINSFTKNVLVDPEPIAEFYFSAASCLGSPVSFYNQSTVPTGFLSNITTWIWDFGDGTTPVSISYPATPDITHLFQGTATTHIVRLTVITNKGCENYIEKTVTSVPSPVANFSFSTTACANQPMQFSDLSQTNGGGSIMSWSWNFGDPVSGANNSATVQNPVHQFSSVTGSPYDVTLVVANGNGCRDTISIPVIVNAKPTSNFTADTACLGSVTSFADISSSVSGFITTRLWEFGDGYTATTPTPQHLYAAPGIYNVKLTVSNSLGCVKDTTKPVVVYGKPVASFNFSSPTCAGDSVQFTDLSTTPNGYITTWIWNFNDGTPPVTVNFPANQNIRHKFTNGGTFQVKLTILTSVDCQAEKINLVQVASAPLANFSFPNSACPNQPLQFSDLTQLNGGTSIVNWNWNFGDPQSGLSNTSTLQNPTHQFTSSGNFIVRLTVTNAAGCTDSVDNGRQVTVNAAPFSAFSWDYECMGSPVHFTDESTTSGSGSIAIWQWNFGDPASGTNNSSTLQNPQHVYNALGTYNITLTVTNSAQCTGDTSMQITINPKPIPMFSYQTACEDTTTQFTDLSVAPNSNIVTWTWDFGDGSPAVSGPDPNPTHVYAASNTYQVKLIVENLQGCRDSVTLPVVVRPRPLAAYTYSSFFCPAGKVNFTDLSQGIGGAGIITTQWIFEPGGPTVTGATPSYLYSSTNMKYPVTLMVENSYHCWDVITDSVFVKPGWGFTFTNDTVCLGSITHFNTINLAQGDILNPVFWDFGDPNSLQNNTSSLYNPVHSFTSSGQFPVKLKVKNSDNCVDSIFRYVRIYAPPLPQFSWFTTPCDSILSFTDSTWYFGDGTAEKWIWRWGDGNSDTIFAPGPGNIQHTYPTAGIYPVTLIIENSNGCSDSIVRNVQRFPCIQAGFSQLDTLCARSIVAFADTSQPVSRINQWRWKWNDGKPDTYYNTFTPVVYHQFDQPGTYFVTLEIQSTVNGVNILDNAVIPVIIRPTPVTLFSYSLTCLGAATTFRDTSTTFGEPISYRKWQFTNTPADTSGIANPVFLFDTAGVYPVKLFVQNRFGCVDSIEKPTRIFSLPLADFASESMCTKNQALFTDQSVPGDTAIVFWKWDFGDPESLKDTSVQQNPGYQYKKQGDFLVRMIIRDKVGCRDTIDSTLRVYQSPVAGFTITEDMNGTPGKIRLNNYSTTDYYNIWYCGSLPPIENETDPIVQFKEDGEYQIALYVADSNGCYDSTVMDYEFLFDNLYVPNAFAPTSVLTTPLGYEVREFKPKGINLQEYHIMVFDKWGHQLWESRKLDSDDPLLPPSQIKRRPVEGWDGTYQGNPMPQDVYIWKINATFTNGKVWEGSDSGTGTKSTMGTVTLIR